MDYYKKKARSIINIDLASKLEYKTTDCSN